MEHTEQTKGSRAGTNELIPDKKQISSCCEKTEVDKGVKLRLKKVTKWKTDACVVEK